MKELQPSVSTSCCREDRHVNNQVDIKSKATTKYLLIFIYSQNCVHRPVHRPCLYMLVSTWWQIRVIAKNLNKTIAKDKGRTSIDDPIEEIPEDDLGGAGVGSRGEGKGKGDGMGKGSTDTKNLQRKSYLQYQG